jgi:hypothetical protein
MMPSNFRAKAMIARRGTTPHFHTPQLSMLPAWGEAEIHLFEKLVRNNNGDSGSEDWRINGRRLPPVTSRRY